MRNIQLKEVLMSISITYIIFGISLYISKTMNYNIYIKLINSIDSLLLLSGLALIISFIVFIKRKKIKDNSRGIYKIKKNDQGSDVCKFKFKNSSYEPIILEVDISSDLIKEKEFSKMTSKEFKNIIKKEAN